MSDVSVIDLSLSNVKSVCKAIEFTGKSSELVDTPESLKKAKKIVLPGVGSFDAAMLKLKKLNLLDALNNKALHEQVPILGICLGYQLMTTSSDEGNQDGLGWFDAKTVSLSKLIQDNSVKIPHMGWNEISWNKGTKADFLIENVREPSRFYFVHSYIPDFKDKTGVFGTSNLGADLDACYIKDNLVGTQFHPEKSHVFGLRLLKNFCST